MRAKARTSKDRRGIHMRRCQYCCLLLFVFMLLQWPPLRSACPGPTRAHHYRGDILTRAMCVSYVLKRAGNMVSLKGSSLPLQPTSDNSTRLTPMYAISCIYTRSSLHVRTVTDCNNQSSSRTSALIRNVLKQCRCHCAVAFCRIDRQARKTHSLSILQV